MCQVLLTISELQRCIVHQVRNTLKYVGAKNKKEFANDLKTIYHAPSEDAALKQLEHVTEKWEKDYPNAMKSWYKNWDVISPIFKFSADVRKVIYTTNRNMPRELGFTEILHS